MPSITEVLLNQDHHDNRMRQAAVLAAKGGEDVDAFLKELADDKLSPWLGMYAIVAAMTKKDGATLGKVATKSKSWVLRARAVQALAKFDQPQVGEILLHQDTPLQLKSVIVRTLVHANDAILQTIQENSVLGGTWLALLVLRRATTTPAHKELVRSWLPKLAKLVKLEPKPGSTFPPLIKSFIFKRIDLENIYQSLAKKYPDVLLEMLGKETDFDFRWYRSSRELAASHPDEMVGILEKQRNSSRGVWFLSRPLVRHRPQEVLQVFKNIGTLSAALAWCFKKVMYNHEHRQLGLGVIAHCCCAPAAVPNDKDIETIVLLLIKLLKSRCSSQKISDTITDLVSSYTDKDSVFEFDKLVTQAKEDEWVFNPSQERVDALVADQMRARRINVKKCKDGMLRVALSRFARQVEHAEVVGEIVKNHSECRSMLARNVVVRVLDEWAASDAFSELDIFTKLSAYEGMDIEKSEEPLKALANTREPSERIAVLSALIRSSAKSPKKTNRLIPVMSWVIMRIAKEEAAVTTPVVKCLLEETPYLNFETESVQHLEELFSLCLRWGAGDWMNSWAYWAASAFVHYRVLTYVKTNAILDFSEGVLTRMQKAEVQTARQILSAYNKAAMSHKLNDKGYASVGMQMVKYAKEAFHKCTAVSTDEVKRHNDLKASEVIDLTNFSLFKGLIADAGAEFILAVPQLADCAKSLVETTTMTYTLSTRWLNEPFETISGWGFWRDMCAKALAGLKKARELPLKICEAVSSYLEKLPITECDYKKKLGKDAKITYAVQRYLQFYQPLLDEACSVYSEMGRQSKKAEFDWPQTRNIFRKYLVDNLRYMPKLDVGIKGIIKLSAVYTVDTRYSTNFTAELIHSMRHPDEHTKDVFKFAVEHVNPRASEGRVIELAEFCDPKHVAYLDERRIQRCHTHAPTFYKRNRFRFQRGTAAARRKASIALKKRHCADRAKDSPNWGLPVARLMEKVVIQETYYITSMLKRLMSSPIVSKTKHTTIKALYTALRNSPTTHHDFSQLWDCPELEAFMAKHVINANVENAVNNYLGPFHKRKRRVSMLLKKGLGSCSPADVFEHSTTFQSYVFRYHPEDVKSLMKDRIQTIALPALVDGVSIARFGGQTTDVKWYVHTLPPSVQQYLWDNWIIPYAFDIKSGALFREQASYENMAGISSEADGHRMKARRLWLGAAMPSAPRMPPVTSAEHPFNKFFAQTIADREAVRKLTEEEKHNVKKSDKLTEGILKGSRSAQLCLELLLALRAHDDTHGVLEVLTAHIDQGVASKVAIPSTAAALRCISPTDACEVLRKVLGRKETRASARSQLGRCCIKLLHPEQALYFVEQEWKQQGSWVMVSDGESDEEGKEDVVFASTKVALICSLVTSSSLKKLPSLWGRVMSISETRTDENIYIAGQMLDTLAGTNGVKTLNTEYWPMCATDGLAGLVASFYNVQTLKEKVLTVLRKWFMMLKCNPSANVSPSDSEGVIHAMQDCTDAPLQCDMIRTLTAAHPGLFAKICKHKVEQIAEVAAGKDLRKLKELRTALSGLMANGETALDKTEYGKAIDVLVQAPGGVAASVQLISNHWAAHKDERSEGPALKKIAEILEHGPATEIALSGLKKEALPRLCREMIAEMDDGGEPSDNEKCVMLKYIKYCNPSAAEPSIGELVKRFINDSCGVVATEAACTLDAMDESVYYQKLEVLDGEKAVFEYDDEW